MKFLNMGGENVYRSHTAPLTVTAKESTLSAGSS